MGKHVLRKRGVIETVQSDRSDAPPAAESGSTSEDSSSYVDEDELARMTEGFSGAEIEGLCIEAGMEAIKESPDNPVIVCLFHLFVFLNYYLRLKNTLKKLCDTKYKTLTHLLYVLDRKTNKQTYK